MQHKVVFFGLESWGKGKEYIMASGKLAAAGVAVEFEDVPLDKDHLPADKNFDIAGIFVDSTLKADTIAALPNLKFIATLSTGFDHVDLVACAARNIVASSVPSYGENTVAEFAFALILALSRKICEANARVRVENKFTSNGLSGFDLAGKTIGVAGTGRIGKHAIRIAKGFGMNIVAYDVIHDNAFAKEMGFSYVSLEELLAQSDVITLHVPSLPATHHLINKENIGLVKKGAYIINTARGGVIETSALVAALESGQLGGAGLDVLEEEHDLKAGNMGICQKLLAMQNVIITPHTAFNTQEAFRRIIDTSIDNIVNFVNGAPTNVVK
jgi:D-lactate dehydrogenase